MSSAAGSPVFPFQVDVRILKAIQKLGFKKPTPIQEQAIPKALEGKDVLARARTGGGKTLAYAIPLINLVLSVCSHVSYPPYTCHVANGWAFAARRCAPAHTRALQPGL